MTAGSPQRLDPIRIEKYDPAWPVAFDDQARRLTPLLGPRLVRPLEHIGSTSIPGMPAKPIVDMLAVIDAYALMPPVLARMPDVGWVLAPEPGDEGRRRWSLCYPGVAFRSHHLHVVEAGEPAEAPWRDWLLFRDYLRTHPSDAERYATVKIALAASDEQDRDRYRAGKAPLIAEILERARTWRDESVD